MANEDDISNPNLESTGHFIGDTITPSSSFQVTETSNFDPNFIYIKKELMDENEEEDSFVENEENSFIENEENSLVKNEENSFVACEIKREPYFVPEDENELIEQNEEMEDNLRDPLDFKRKKSTEQNEELVQVKRIKTTDNNLFVCAFCEASFTHMDNLNQHIDTIHEGKEPFECLICSAQ